MSKAQYRESKLLWLYNYLHLKSGFQFSLDQLRSCSEKVFHFHEDKSFRFCLPGIPFTSWWRLSYFIFFPKYFLKFWSLNLEFCCFIFLYFFVYFTDSNIWIFVLFLLQLEVGKIQIHILAMLWFQAFYSYPNNSWTFCKSFNCSFWFWRQNSNSIWYCAKSELAYTTQKAPH